MEVDAQFSEPPRRLRLRGDPRPDPPSAEFAFVLACVSAFVAPDGTSPLAKWATRWGDLDWAAVVDIAERHGVAGILASALKGAPAPPAGPAAQRLRARLIAQAVTHANHRAALAEAVAALRQRGLSSIVLKGLGVASRVYPLAEARRLGDIDLLVPSGRFEEAVEALQHLGFVLEGRLPNPAGPRAGGDYHAVLVRPGAAAVPLELHFVLCDDDVFDNPQSPLDTARCWARAREGGPFGTARLAPEDELLYLCAHAGKHDWRSLYVLADIALLAASGAVDWHTARERSAAFGPAWTYEASLLLTAILLEAPLPPPLAQHLEEVWGRHRRLRRFVRHVISDWIYQRHDGDALHRFSPWTRQLAGQKSRAALQRSAADHARHWLHFLFHPDGRDREVFPLPSPLAPLRYVLRPARLALIHARYSAYRATRTLRGE